ncbi:hypothetical protein HYH03_012664 [Edaphochlamys debaryana]|uniref:Uncharacterized protein n=1 Tax=Edaphochlamys debaryana TaxID=47281 RepID=A0A835Y0C7_9CHLO|nr:hypothetical protein HYH03_012664 [Edaphochlamys debaryana]|eukprot:KAG2488869.1 hypothetical protein HYH03_012664 [Edaphochlamys debaryana]
MGRGGAAGYDDDLPGPSPYAGEYLYTFAATTIQRWFRGYRVRKEHRARMERVRQLEMAWATTYDARYRADMAARRIQTAWRGFRNRRIFMYYRDLIRFRERGDPRELLKVINPREAQLVDAAAGIHVRFRLGGTMFPPLVFYKIFTHRPLIDIGAFGPRDYANEVRLTPAEIHNKPPTAAPPGLQLRAPGPGAASGGNSQSQTPTRRGAAGAGAGGGGGTAGGAGPAPGASAGASAKKKHTFQEEDFELDNSFREYIKPDGTIGWRSTQGWYERLENNGWRPVAERVLLDEDPVTTATRLKRQPLFHFNPAVRRENRARQLKERKREWLRKMYADGGGRPLSARVRAAAGAGILPGSANYEDDGFGLDPTLLDLNLNELDDQALDERADELLAWSQHLDYGSYFDDWTSIACTMASEAFVPEDEAPYLAEVGREPYVGDIRRAFAQAGAPLEPFKGGPNASCGTVLNMR